ncbi:MAG TPA: type II toxin-antitoxin system RelE/ParE family toxin [Burkholderiaceae bacterium]
MPKVYQRATARRDLVDHFVYLAENAGVGTAERFLTQVEASFDALAAHPEIGALLTFRSSDLAGLRKWRVNEFDNYLVFYKPRPDGVSIVRVLHAARDWWSLLGIAP